MLHQHDLKFAEIDLTRKMLPAHHDCHHFTITTLGNSCTYTVHVCFANCDETILSSTFGGFDLVMKLTKNQILVLKLEIP